MDNKLIFSHLFSHIFFILAKKKKKSASLKINFFCRPHNENPNYSSSIEAKRAGGSKFKPRFDGHFFRFKYSSWLEIQVSSNPMYSVAGRPIDVIS